MCEYHRFNWAAKFEICDRSTIDVMFGHQLLAVTNIDVVSHFFCAFVVASDVHL